MKIAILLLLLAAGLAGYLTFFLIRSASHDPDVWHVDPLTFPSSDTPNSFRLAPSNQTEQRVDEEAPVYAASAQDIARAIDDYVLRQRDTQRVGGSPESLWTTYVQRTPTLNFPDYISVKVIALEGDRSTVAVYSRSRYGHGDMGVNRKRITSWFASLSSLEE